MLDEKNLFQMNFVYLAKMYFILIVFEIANLVENELIFENENYRY